MTSGVSTPSPSRNSFDVATDDLLFRAGELLADGFRLATVAAHDDVSELRVVYVFVKGPPDERIELVVRVDASAPSVPSLASVSFPASRFEREMRDLFGIEPLGHPQSRRLVLHQHWAEGWHPMRRDPGAQPEMLTQGEGYPFIPVEGPGVYEVPVGPVHAGLIEPGHFRFFVVGETILRMKARLWFVHKGIEKLVEGKTIDDAFEVAQRISGDTTVGHGLAFMLAVEEALGLEVADEHRVRRAQVLELERLYNHVADIGALCNDVGYSVANAMALTIRERLLELNEELTGHRLLRGAVTLGGSSLRRPVSVEHVERIRHQVQELLDVVRSNALVLDRFNGTATLTRDDARDLGTLGVVARASGIELDARVAHPFVVMPEGFSVVTDQRGDVMARLDVRAREIDVSLTCLCSWAESAVAQTATSAPAIETRDPSRTYPGPRSGLGLVEGWRGTIVHRVEVDADARIRRLKVVDPSFFNWPALPVSLADTILPDFPVANKSFNLSYAGNDL